MPVVHFRYLYHFTHPDNIASIQLRGLLSWYRLDASRMRYNAASTPLSRNLDTGKGLHDYVHLCTRPYHAMAQKALDEKRVSSLVWLRIAKEPVISWPETRFTYRNAAHKFARPTPDSATAFDSPYHDAEVLVLGHLEPRWILAYRIDPTRETPL